MNTAVIVDAGAEEDRKKETKTNRTKQVDDADAEKKQNSPSMPSSVLESHMPVPRKQAFSLIVPRNPRYNIPKNIHF